MTDPQPWLRCSACSDGQNHYDHQLREQIAEAIKRFPNTDATWWIGPESVLGRVEEHLSDRLREAKADAWDEGYAAGWEFDGTEAYRPRNPHRETP